MLRRVAIPILFAVSIVGFVPFAAYAKGGSPIDYFTIVGPGMLWPARFTAELGSHLPYDHEVRATSHPLDTRHFVVRGYVEDDMEHGFSPFYLWLGVDDKADIYVAGEEASGFHYRWFSARPEFVAPVRQAILLGFALTAFAFASPAVIGVLILIGAKKLRRRAEVLSRLGSPIQT